MNDAATIEQLRLICKSVARSLDMADLEPRDDASAELYEDALSILTDAGNGLVRLDSLAAVAAGTRRRPITRVPGPRLLKVVK